MNELVLDSPGTVAPPDTADGPIREALLESRQRWQALVGLAADLAFETDAEGRFVFLMPDPVLGWDPGTLIGQTADGLIGADDTGGPNNPFRPVTAVRRHRTWLRRADGKLALMAVSSVPLHGDGGAVVGARGIGIDMTDYDAETGLIAGWLRRGQLLHHIISRVGRESEVDRMMDTALWALIHAAGAEGAAVIGSVAGDGPVGVLHECGPGASAVLETASTLVARAESDPGEAVNPDGRQVLAAGCQTRFSARAGLAIWRRADARRWDQEDVALTGAVLGVVRMILEYEALRQELLRQARTDPLTGLPNRRAFIEAVRRDLPRLDRTGEPGTLLCIDMDWFKAVNDTFGHGTGDQVLLRFAAMLRKMVRPNDVVTRMGGDEFALWLSGADHMTAAERADFLCRTAPGEMRDGLPETLPPLGVSVGIATRRAGSGETLEALMRRADMAMYEVKRSGRHHWRVSLLDREG